jgi:C_GCAxxG_C_C family probable redox protein
MNRLDTVMKYRNEKKYNCAQCVFCSYSDELGITPDTAFRLSECLGGGFGHQGEICGALTGAGLVLSSHVSSGEISGKMNTYDQIQSLTSEFRKKTGSIYCRDIKGFITGKPLVSCEECIKTAVNVLEKELNSIIDEKGSL